ncbi:HEAT repeat domain-containing protein [Thermoactinomyces mirandus]|uniref:HEAT repeat domain-containing protein n=1 Tax=Thermoactinomyces mirandus TaxID=2756294 RepID=A0A7W1XV40_9BACL|nr:HEAT repeat domain-containing protein [Thermoactinomyces mirandus]MBA4603810.1 HEAT repeat domain-containing protein [Thermoactinomyces mirandus]
MADREVLSSALMDLTKGKEKSRMKVAKKFSSASTKAKREVILRGLKSKDHKVRRTTLALIGEMQDSQFIDEVTKGLKDRYTDVIQMAVWSIGRLKWKKALPDLIHLVKKGYGFKVIKTVVWAFGEIGDKSVIPILREMLEDASARLSEGILVCGIKLGHDAFVELIQSLNCDLPSVQSALRDASFASGQIRGAFIRAVTKTKDTNVLKSLLNALPYVTLHDADYKRLLDDKREVVRIAVYQSISNSALPKAIKQSYLVKKALSDESNKIVMAALENLLPYVDESVVVKRNIESVANHHPSPKVRDLANGLLEQHEKYQQVGRLVPKWGHFLLETLPGLERFVGMETDILGIEFEKGKTGNGWMKIKLGENDSSLEDLKKLHTVARICGVVSITNDVAGTKINPFIEEIISDVRAETFSFEQAKIDNNTFELMTTIAEREMVRPSRKLRATSLDWRVARAMVLCSNPKTDDVFVDPTCGSGTLLLDRMMIGPYEKLVGGDRDSEAIETAKRNLQGVNNVQLYQWDAASMKLENESVTVIAANLPFGRRVGSHEGNVDLYPSLLKEIMRVLRGNGRVVLLTQEVKLLLDTIKPFKRKVVVELDQPVEMGGLTPHIICLRKKSEPPLHTAN